MNSTITSKFQTTIPKKIREQLGISVRDSLEWRITGGKAVVVPVHNEFNRHRGIIKTGAGDIATDIAAARLLRAGKFR